MMEVEIKAGPGGEGTAWSCPHGVGRWYRDCGCHTNGQEGWTQAWRTPLRDALNALRDHTATLFEEGTADLLRDPWAARDGYIDLVLSRGHAAHEWLSRHAKRSLDHSEKHRVLSFLEMQRNSLLMFTSCGWFFADISRVETVQILSYAARALDWMEALGLETRRERFLDVLAQTRSNVPELGDGADVFARFVEPRRVKLQHAASHLALAGLATEGDPEKDPSLSSAPMSAIDAPIS
jgi:hypothetical protein